MEREDWFIQCTSTVGDAISNASSAWSCRLNECKALSETFSEPKKTPLYSVVFLLYICTYISSFCRTIAVEDINRLDFSLFAIIQQGESSDDLCFLSLIQPIYRDYASWLSFSQCTHVMRLSKPDTALMTETQPVSQSRFLSACRLPPTF